MLRFSTITSLAVLFVAAMPACGGGIGGVRYQYEGVQGVVTLTNLHPDARRNRVYSTNYLQGGLIGVCTPVLIQSVNRKQMTFTDLNTNQQYEYIFDRHMTEDYASHLDRHFGTDCKQQYIAQMSEIDQQGIREGKILAGMTREGVVVAAGYPPPHQTNMQGDVWRYYTNRYNSFQVFFVDQLVQYVRE